MTSVVVVTNFVLPDTIFFSLSNFTVMVFAFAKVISLLVIGLSFTKVIFPGPLFLYSKVYELSNKLN